MNIYFDFDGTIADTGPALVEAVRLSFLEQDLPAPTAEQIIPLSGFPLQEILGMLLGHAPDSQEIFEFRELVEKFYAEMALGEICLFPKMRELLHELSPKANLMGILTNKPTKCVLNETKHLEIQPYFHVILGADVAGAAKPATDILDMAHIMLELPEDIREESAQNSLMIGDSTADMGLAKATGMTAIGVTWGAQSASVLKEGGADHIAQTTSELREILLALLKK
ncbi:HAD family hydrolase [Acetobacteraceae bacterium]|nr:HAD family hydrolase [Acetobacteraceae bacterium]